MPWLRDLGTGCLGPSTAAVIGSPHQAQLDML
jgi:hypothetical protein